MWCMLGHLVGHSDHSDQEQTHTSAGATGEASPREILKRRFALGEISRGQFEEMMRVLSAAEITDRFGH